MSKRIVSWRNESHNSTLGDSAIADDRKNLTEISKGDRLIIPMQAPPAVVGLSSRSTVLASLSISRHNQYTVVRRSDHQPKTAMDSPANTNDPNDEQPRCSKKARLLEGDLAEDEEKEEATQKEGDSAAVAKMDTAVVANTWSPRRASRGGIKVRSLADGNFRGGDFVLDTDGNACTVSFLFEKDNKIYGFTAGHLAEVGEPLEVFAESKKHSRR
jgi:hypothetical protein